MSTRKMLADSTQDAFSKKRKTVKARKKDPKKRKSPELDHDSELLDLNVNLLPISGYIKNPEEMIDQIFMSVRGGTLNGLVPSILKNLPEKELRDHCLSELEVMSKKRVKRIIAGEDPDDISSSDSDDDFESEDESAPKMDDEEEAGELVDISDVEEGQDEERSEGSVDDSGDDTMYSSSKDAVTNDCLDDVSSVESFSDFRNEQGMKSAADADQDSDVEVDYLEIKPRVPHSDMEDGEVMSSDEEDCDPTWRSRGEEAVERREKECDTDDVDCNKDREHSEPLQGTSDSLESPTAIEATGSKTTDNNLSADLSSTDTTSELSLQVSQSELSLQASQITSEDISTRPIAEQREGMADVIDSSQMESNLNENAPENSKVTKSNSELNRHNERDENVQLSSVLPVSEDVGSTVNNTKASETSSVTTTDCQVVDGGACREEADVTPQDSVPGVRDVTPKDSVPGVRDVTPQDSVLGVRDVTTQDSVPGVRDGHDNTVGDIFAALNRASSSSDDVAAEKMEVDSLNCAEVARKDLTDAPAEEGEPSAKLAPAEEGEPSAKPSHPQKQHKTRKIKVKQPKESDNIESVASNVSSHKSAQPKTGTSSSDRRVMFVKKEEYSFEHERAMLLKKKKEKRNTGPDRIGPDYQDTVSDRIPDTTLASHEDAAHSCEDVLVVAENYPEDISDFENSNKIETEESERAVQPSAEPLSGSNSEILELEMRARAIKAMLKAQDD